MGVVTTDEFKALVGTDIGASDWLTVNQAMIDKFAEATGDYQFIHVDVEQAKLTPFGGTIAHGFLTLSLLPRLAEMSDLPSPPIQMGVNYGCDKLRFITPVRSGKRVRGRFKLLDLVEKRTGQWQQTQEITVEIEGEDKPALIAQWITQFFV